MKKAFKAFTLIKVIVVVAILVILGSILLGACGWIAGGCSGGQGSLLVNPYHSSTLTIKVTKSYAMAGELANVYRVVGTIIEDSDGNTGNETFEITDSWLDGNFSSADLFGMITDGKTYRVTCRGERSGVRSSFRGITGAEEVTAEVEVDQDGW